MLQTIVKWAAVGAFIGLVLFLIFGGLGIAGGMGALSIGLLIYILFPAALGAVGGALWRSGRP